jgi:hypothetical protein
MIEYKKPASFSVYSETGAALESGLDAAQCSSEPAGTF